MGHFEGRQPLPLNVIDGVIVLVGVRVDKRRDGIKARFLCGQVTPITGVNHKLAFKLRVRLQAKGVFHPPLFACYLTDRLHRVGQFGDFCRVYSLATVVRVWMDFADRYFTNQQVVILWFRRLYLRGTRPAHQVGQVERIQPAEVCPFTTHSATPIFSKIMLKASWNSLAASRAAVFFRCQTGLPSESASGIDERMPILAAISR